MEKHEADASHLESASLKHAPSSDRDAAADEARRVEVNMTIREAFSHYKKAVAWSLGISMSTIMDSYDLLLITSFFAYPQFQKKYGVELADGSYSIPARWQLALTIIMNGGLIFGVFSNGYFADRFGLRKVMMVAHVALIGFIFVTFFAPNIEVLLVGTFLIAIPCGFFAAATPSYAAEVAPMRLTGYLTVYVNLCWVMGKLIAFGVLRGMLSDGTEWAYRVPYGLQWMWPPFMLVAIYFAPESPWWLVKKGRYEEAEKSLRRLCSAPDNVINPKNTIALMARTIETERAMGVSGTYLDCFRGENLRRTEIAMVSWGCQILPGFAVQNYITYFFTMAGLSATDSFTMSIGNAGLAFCGTVSSWFLMTRFGWRRLYISGLVAMLPVMSLVGFLDLKSGSKDTIRWVQSALLLVWFFIYGCTIGPIPYGIAANVGAANVRIKTISLGRNTYYFLSIINVVASPYMLNPQEGDLKGKAAFPAAALTLLLLLWAWFRLPEIKGMTSETLDHLFSDNVPTRRFPAEAKKYQ